MNRRSLLKNSAAAFSGVLLTSKVLQAKTPAQPEGPFYPVVDQIDKSVFHTKLELPMLYSNLITIEDMKFENSNFYRSFQI